MKQLQQTILSRRYNYPIRYMTRQLHWGKIVLLHVVAIEVKFNRNCYTGFIPHYNVICKRDTAIEDFEVIAENELLQFIQEEIAGGRNIFALQNLTDMMTERLEQHWIQKTVNLTRLKKTVLKHWFERRETYLWVFIFSSKAARKIISVASQIPEEEAHTLLMAASILRKASLQCLQCSWSSNCIHKKEARSWSNSYTNIICACQIGAYWRHRCDCNPWVISITSRMWMRLQKSESPLKLERQPEWYLWTQSSQTWAWLQRQGSLHAFTPHLLLGWRASNPATGWCTKCHSSWRNCNNRRHSIPNIPEDERIGGKICSSRSTSSRCKCMKEKLKCTRLCKCKCVK